MFQNILIPVDGSEHANNALAVGSDLATHYGARVTVLHVMEEIGSNRVPDGFAELGRIEHIRMTETDVLTGVGREIVDRAALRCRELGVKTVREQLAVGNPRREILRLAREDDVDLIVMGRRGLGQLSDLLLGSVSHRVTQGAECACLTVK